MTLYTHCQKCGRQLTSLSSKMRGYGWECWRKIQDEAPGLFDDDNVSEAEEVKTEKQGRTRKAGPRRIRTRPAQVRKLWALGSGWPYVAPRAATVAGRAGYYRKRRVAMRRLPLQKA